MKNYQKKGQITQSTGAIVALIVGVGVATLVLIFVGVLGGQTYNLSEANINSIGNSSVVNRSVSLNNVTEKYLGHADIHSGTLEIWNATAKVSLTNFTINYETGYAIVNDDSLYWAGTNTLNATYNWGLYALRDSVKNGISSGFESLESTGDYLPIIVLAVVIALVLGLVVVSVGGLGRSGGGSAL